ncbi:MAG TPA: Crp/Fnr family transcriptional regulator [Bacteroidales bacterium]|nr:Crp/Fnr family transcriptional regulator [Bacteroidales bacterium]
MDYSIFIQSPLFTGLDVAEIERALSTVPNRVRKYKSDSLIFQGGESVKTFVFVLSGYVKGEMVDYTGRVIKIEDIKAPGAVAPAFLFGKKNKYPVNVIAVPDTTLMFIEKNDFLGMLSKNKEVLINFLDMISSRSQFLSEKIKFLSFKTIKSKLAQYILELAKDGRDEIRLDRTQADLADYFGVTRPSVGRALSDLEQAGVIETNGKIIRIIRRDELSDLSID